MRLNYRLLDIIDNHSDGGCAKYDYIRSEIWFSKQELCDEVSEFLGVDIPIETNVVVSKEQKENVWKLLSGRPDLIGMYGDEFLNEWKYE